MRGRLVEYLRQLADIFEQSFRSEGFTWITESSLVLTVFPHLIDLYISRSKVRVFLFMKRLISAKVGLCASSRFQHSSMSSQISCSQCSGLGNSCNAKCENERGQKFKGWKWRAQSKVCPPALGVISGVRYESKVCTRSCWQQTLCRPQFPNARSVAFCTCHF